MACWMISDSAGDMCRELLRLGADARARQSTGDIPLHFACTMGNTAAIDVLIEHDPTLMEVTNNFDMVPLSMACQFGRADAIQHMLTRHQALIKPVIANSWLSPTAGGTLAVAAASGTGDVETLRLLLDNGHKPNLTRPNPPGLIRKIAKLSVFMCRVQKKPGAMFQQFGLAWPCANPLHMAAFLGNIGIVELMLDATDVDMAEANQQGFTALHLASMSGHAHVVERLLAAGAPLDVRDKFMRRTPAMWAKKRGHTAVAALLDVAKTKETAPSRGFVCGT